MVVNKLLLHLSQTEPRNPATLFRTLGRCALEGGRMMVPESDFRKLLFSQDSVSGTHITATIVSDVLSTNKSEQTYQNGFPHLVRA